MFNTRCSPLDVYHWVFTTGVREASNSQSLTPTPSHRVEMVEFKECCRAQKCSNKFTESNPDTLMTGVREASIDHARLGRLHLEHRHHLRRTRRLLRLGPLPVKRNGLRTCLVQMFGRAGTNLGRERSRRESNGFLFLSPCLRGPVGRARE